MSGLFVDVEGLRTLADRMARTRDEVAHAARLVGDCDGRAAGLLAAALADFGDHWRYGLDRIVGNLDACHGALRDAASGYERTDDAIAQAASRE